MLALFFATMPIAARRQQRLARSRRPIDAAGFEQAMAARGVTPTTARFLWTDLQPFYHQPLRPVPDDRLESMIAVDRPEIEGLVARFWGGMRGNDPQPRAAPLGNDPSILELGRYLDLLIGWSIKGSA